jgi:uncharacterized repeat protein (TIGR03803 family)
MSTTRIRRKFLVKLPGIIACLALIPHGLAAAQTFTNLYSFTADSNGTNHDGADPFADLFLFNGRLYGTSEHGGTNANGTVFSINIDGSHFTTLHTFATRSDLNAQGGVIFSSNILYGTEAFGGTNNQGAVFALAANGLTFTNLHSFIALDDGTWLSSSLLLLSNTLYGTAQAGGANNAGTIFKINTDGTDFTNLHSFAANPFYLYTNSDGASPIAGLIASGSDTLFGSATSGGTNGQGTIFRINTDGTGFTVLHTFGALLPTNGDQTNTDGAGPNGLLLSGNTLYGTATEGGEYGNGTIFSLNTNGSNFRVLHAFSASVSVNVGNSILQTNEDGAYPTCDLVTSGTALYGTAEQGGANGNGTVYQVSFNGSNFWVLHTFEASDPTNYSNADGSAPQSGMVLSSNVLYGTTYGGGTDGCGTLFSITLLNGPVLGVSFSFGNLLFTWPTNSPGFTLQTTTDLTPPVVWSDVVVTPITVNGQNVASNPISGLQQFYRLSQQP